MSTNQLDHQIWTQLRPALAGGPETSALQLRPTAPASGRSLSTVPRHWLMSAAALLLLAVPVVLLLVRSFNSGSDGPVIPAPMNGLSQSSAATCSVEPRAIMTVSGTPEHEAILFANTNDWYPNIPSSRGPVLYEADLPTGPEASPEDLAGIQQTLETLAACLYERDYASVEALFSDDSIRRTGSNRGEGVQGTPIATTSATESKATPINPRGYLTHVVTPIILSSNVLPDGRIGVLLEQDLTGYGVKQYFILVDSDRGWLVDEAIYVTSRAKPSMVMFKITAIDLKFDPARIEIPADTDVTIVVSNEGMARKTLVVPELNINVELPPGEEVPVLINAPKGVYEFYSDVPGQRVAGMHGTIIVLP
ncbi:MAG: cupredoxin domain-containing protein [Thermomicrobiales bacterium]|nr:cupredoxin domain-containing protein [Thermomicrobiales bacterium]